MISVIYRHLEKVMEMLFYSSNFSSKILSLESRFF